MTISSPWNSSADGGVARTEAERDSMVGGMVWPVWRAFLDGDLTLKEWAKASDVRPRQIEDAFLEPGKPHIGFWGALAYGLGARLVPDFHRIEEHEERLCVALGFNAARTPQVASTGPGMPDEPLESPTQ